MIIAFIGTSGSGKSTIIKEIVASNIFKGKPLLVKNEDDFYTINLLKAIFGKESFEEYKKEKFFVRERTSVKPFVFSTLVYFFYPVLVYFEFLIEYIFYEYFFRNKIVLRDRYVYDYIVTFNEVLGIYHPLARFIFSRFPKPDLAFYLKIDLETSLKRNKNNIVGKITYEPHLHDKIIRQYEYLAKVNNLIVVPSKNDYKDSLNTIINTILERMNK